MLSKYKLAIGIVIVIGLVLILMLPKYRAHQLLTQARTAAERGKEIAFLLDMYKNKYHRSHPISHHWNYRLIANAKRKTRNLFATTITTIWKTALFYGYNMLPYPNGLR